MFRVSDRDFAIFSGLPIMMLTLFFPAPKVVSCRRRVQHALLHSFEPLEDWLCLALFSESYKFVVFS